MFFSNSICGEVTVFIWAYSRVLKKEAGIWNLLEKELLGLNSYFFTQLSAEARTTSRPILLYSFYLLLILLMLNKCDTTVDFDNLLNDSW